MAQSASASITSSMVRASRNPGGGAPLPGAAQGFVVLLFVVAILVDDTIDNPRLQAAMGLAIGREGHFDSQRACVRDILRWIELQVEDPPEAEEPPPGGPAVPLENVQGPMAAINIGLESFQASLSAQGAQVVQMDWRPPAGGNEKLASLLSRMKSGQG